MASRASIRACSAIWGATPELTVLLVAMAVALSAAAEGARGAAYKAADEEGARAWVGACSISWVGFWGWVEFWAWVGGGITGDDGGGASAPAHPANPANKANHAANDENLPAPDMVRLF